MQFLDSLRSVGARIMATATQVLNTPLVGSGGVIVNTTPDALKSILATSEVERCAQERVIVARAFHDGKQGVKLTPRLREFLGDECSPFGLRFNMVAKVNKAIAERLVIQSFSSSAIAENEKNAQVAFANAVWGESRMKSKRAAVMLNTIRDGESFILIDFNKEGNIARFTPHQRYTDATTTCEGHAGDGEGMFMVYPNGDVDQKPLYAVKRWVEQVDNGNGTTKGEPRINIYYPDRVEKYALRRGWELIDNTPNLRADGSPFGVPVVHVKTPSLAPATTEAIVIQKALNKAFTDLLATSDQSAFRIMIALGWEPVDKDGRPIAIEPGVVLGTRAPANSASVVVVQPADLSGPIQVLDKHVTMMADVTGVPITKLNTSSQVRAEGTLQEEKESFGAIIRDDKDTTEISIEDGFKIGRRFQNEYGDESASQAAHGFGKLDEAPSFRVEWEPFTTRSISDRKAEADVLRGIADDADILVKALDWDAKEAEATVAKRLSRVQTVAPNVVQGSGAA